MQFDLVAIEAQSGRRAMYSRHTRASPSPTSRTDSSQWASRLATHACSVRVVLPQILFVANLETVVLHRGNDGADGFELAVGEHVPVDELAGAGRNFVVGRVMQ